MQIVSGTNIPGPRGKKVLRSSLCLFPRPCAMVGGKEEVYFSASHNDTTWASNSSGLRWKGALSPVLSPWAAA